MSVSARVCVRVFDLGYLILCVDGDRALDEVAGSVQTASETCVVQRVQVVEVYACQSRWLQLKSFKFQADV